MLQGVTVEWEYGYDALNRLRSVRRSGALVARYAYDVLGRRIAKRVYSSSTGGTVGYTRLVYHGDHVAFETDSAGTIGLRYTWNRGTDQLAGVRDASGNQYYAVTDKLGSVRGLVRQDGAWWSSQRFGPYGERIARDTTTAGPAVKLRYAWTGRELDTETGWYYHRSRYYSPVVRRFVQEDAIGFEGGLNLYAYVEGQVMEAVDPDGLIMKAPGELGSGGRGGVGGMSAEELIGWAEAGYEAWQARASRTEVVVTYAGGSVVTYRVPTNSGQVEMLVTHYENQRYDNQRSVPAGSEPGGIYRNASLGGASGQGKIAVTVLIDGSEALGRLEKSYENLHIRARVTALGLGRGTDYIGLLFTDLKRGGACWFCTLEGYKGYYYTGNLWLYGYKFRMRGKVRAGTGWAVFNNIDSYYP